MGKALKQKEKGKQGKEKTEKAPKEKVIKPEGSTKAANKKKKSSKNKKELKFNTFIHKVLKQVHPDVGITKQGMTVMNDLVCNAFYSIAEEAGRLVKLDGREQLSARDINCAVRLTLPGDLAQHSNDEGMSALRHYETATKKQAQPQQGE